MSALIFSIGLTQTGSAQFRPALLVLLTGSALPLVLAWSARCPVAIAPP